MMEYYTMVHIYMDGNVFIARLHIRTCVNTSPDGNILDWSKLKPNKCVPEIQIRLEKDRRKHCWKRRKCWLPVFSPFPTMFSTLLYTKLNV